MTIFDTEDLLLCLQISVEEADAVVTGLLVDDCIGPTTPRGNVPRHCLTDKGTQLGLASFATRLKRAAADQLLAEVIARAADTEAQRPLVFQVTKIALFGSMLGDAALVPELDFAMKVRSAFTDETLAAAQQRRIQLAAHGGKRLSTLAYSILCRATRLPSTSRRVDHPKDDEISPRGQSRRGSHNEVCVCAVPTSCASPFLRRSP